MGKGSYQPENSEKDILLRKYRDTFATCGIAVIVFSVWDIVKLVIGLFLGEKTLGKMISEGVASVSIQDAEREKWVMFITGVIIVIGLVILVAIVFLFHLYIGMNAYRAGRQTAEKKRWAYLVLAGLAMVGSGAVVVFNIVVMLFGRDQTGSVGLATLLLEATCFLNYASLLFPAFQIFKLERGAL